MYTHELFGGERDLHVGIDIGAPVGEPIYAFSKGIVHSLGINAEDGSYGPTIIIKHEFEGKPIWALYGHLSMESLDMVSEGWRLPRVKLSQLLATKASTVAGSHISISNFHGKNQKEMTCQESLLGQIEIGHWKSILTQGWF